MLRILPILALLGAAMPVAAQDDAAAPAAPDLGAVLELLGAPQPEPEREEEADPYADLAERLSVCLRPLYPDSPAHGDIVLGVEVTAEGRPTQPFLIEPPIADAGIPHLRQLFRAEAALYDCAPLPVAEGGDTLRLAARADTLTPVTPAEPAPGGGRIQVELPGVPATAADERALELRRAQRRELQVRLRLAGFDPQGVDGIFGPDTRSAIADWQAARDLPVSGYLNEVQRDRLIGETEQAYTELRAAGAERQGSGGRFYRGRDGCLRYRGSDRIVPDQGFTCDVKGMFQF